MAGSAHAGPPPSADDDNDIFDDIFEDDGGVDQNYIPPVDEPDEPDGHVGPAYPCDKPIAIFPATEIGNADRLIYYHGHDLRYCYPWKQWLVWQGTHWQENRNGEIDRRMEDVTRKILLEAAMEEDEDKRKAKAGWALTSMSNKVIKNSIERARSKAPIIPEQLDTSLFLLNCRNGTLNLQSGKLLPHNRGHLITKMIPVDYDANATCPLWRQSIGRIFGGSEELIAFMQRAIGYTLTGDIREQMIFILHGNGANGKSTLLDTIGALMSDYGQQTPADTLMMKRDRGIPNDIARMRGARFISAVETEEGRRLSEVLVKQLTGGDLITARFLNQEFFEFKPTHKIFLATNHLPRVKGTDHAIWRRLPLIPFDVQFWNPDKDESGPPELKADKTLPAKLLEELPGILNWALEGCLSWQKTGIGWPAAVRQASNAYRADMDTLNTFLTEMCEEDKDARIPMKPLYAAYKKWCHDNGEPEASQKSFGKSLEERGYKAVSGTGNVAMRCGIVLADQQRMEM